MQDWRDDRLRWKVEDFDNLSNVVLRPDRIWLPELALMNGFVDILSNQSPSYMHLIFLLLPQFTVLILIILMQLIHAYQLFILSFFYE